MLLLQSDADAADDAALFPTPPHAGFAFIPAHSLSIPSAPVTQVLKQVLTQTSAVWEEEQELCPRSFCPRHGLVTPRGQWGACSAAAQLPPKMLIPTAHSLGYSQVHSALSCQEPVFFQISLHTCLFAPFLRNINNFMACFNKMLVTNCHRA